MKEIYNYTYTIKNLIKEFDRGVFAVPEIQREFVWNAKKACTFADSIYRNYPIGIAMIWDTDRKNHNLLRRKLHVLPPYDYKKNKDIYFIIDGQQRLSVLYHLFKGDKIVNYNGIEVDFSRIYYSLWQEDDVIFEYIKRPDPEWHVRLTDILDPRWRYRMAGMPKYKMSRIRQCRERILNYNFHMIFVRTNNIEEVRETFIRINAQGTPISAADRAFTRATSFNLRHLINEARYGLEYGFNAVPRETLLMTIALANGAKEVGEKAIDATVKAIEKDDRARKHFNKTWRHLREAIGKAVDYIYNNLGVLNYGFLPSTNMITTLALFFFYNNNSQPNSRQKTQLRKWFWSTAVGQRYAGAGFRRNILNDAEFFKRLGRNRKGLFIIQDKIPVYMLKHTDYSKRSGISDAYFCLLGLNRPRYLEEGDNIPLQVYSTRANRNDKHHIFPRDLLKRNGFAKRDYNSIGNICFIVAKENQSIGSKRPAIYLKDIHFKKHFPKVMKSHLIPYSQTSGLWDTNIRKGYKMFLDERIALVAKGFEELAGTKLFRHE